jgi:hypothetical protein
VAGRRPLSVVEVHTPILEGYAGFYDQASDEITISEDLDDLTIVHEASHAWFNKRLFTERWIGEGLADEYASQVLTTLGRKAEGPASVKRGADAAFALESWPPPAPIRDDAQDARERYGYDASWVAMRQIVRLVGEEGMRRLFAAAEAGTTAYPARGRPRSRPCPTTGAGSWTSPTRSRRRTAWDAVVRRWALAPRDAGLLPPRAAARAAYATLAEDGGTWAPPDSVRTAMDAWRFGAATDAMAAATTVLERRDEVATLADARAWSRRPAARPATRTPRRRGTSRCWRTTWARAGTRCRPSRPPQAPSTGRVTGSSGSASTARTRTPPCRRPGPSGRRGTPPRHGPAPRRPSRPSTPRRPPGDPARPRSAGRWSRRCCSCSWSASSSRHDAGAGATCARSRPRAAPYATLPDHAAPAEPTAAPAPVDEGAPRT